VCELVRPRCLRGGLRGGRCAGCAHPHLHLPAVHPPTQSHTHAHAHALARARAHAHAHAHAHPSVLAPAQVGLVAEVRGLLEGMRAADTRAALERAEEGIRAACAGTGGPGGVDGALDGALGALAASNERLEAVGAQVGAWGAGSGCAVGCAVAGLLGPCWQGWTARWARWRGGGGEAGGGERAGGGQGCAAQTVAALLGVQWLSCWGYRAGEAWGSERAGEACSLCRVWCVC